MPRSRIDIVGQQFGDWTVTGFADDPRKTLCKCSCGTVREVRTDALKSGVTRSCGCLPKPGWKGTHGASGTPAYSTWLAMRQRCGNPRSTHYDRYGGRGISISSQWSEFANFLADMGQPEDGQTIERIDNDGPYSPDNCRWASRMEQMNNRGINRFMTHGGKTLTISQWAREVGMKRNTLDERLANGVPFSDAIVPDRRIDLDQIRAAAARSSVARKARTHCKHGHEYTPENTRHNGRQRICRTCHRNDTARRKMASRI